MRSGRISTIGALVSVIISGCAAPTKKAATPSQFSAPYSVGFNIEKAVKELGRSASDETTFPADPRTLVTVYPLTAAIVEGQERQRGEKAMDPPAEIAAKVLAAKKELVQDRTCFVFLVRSVEIEQGQFKNWRTKLELKPGELIEMGFHNTKGVESVPSADRLGNYRFVNASTACTAKAINLTPPFTLHAIPLYPRGQRISMGW